MTDYQPILDEYFERLTEDDFDQFLATPLQDKTARLAEFLGRDEVLLFSKIADRCQLPLLDDIIVPDQPQKLLPLRIIYEYKCLPLNASNGTLDVVTVWPPTPTMTQWIEVVTGQTPKWHLIDSSKFMAAVSQIFGVGFESLEQTDLENLEEAGMSVDEDDDDQDAAIIRFVNEIILKALDDRATDIHFEPQRGLLQIRYRIDGELVPVQLPENLVRLQAAIISRIKIMSRLNISEKRRPQDGRIRFKFQAREIDIRVSTFPTAYGESISLRLLNLGNAPKTFKELGFLEADENKIKPFIYKPHGIVLVTGPTGSGKSTTLSACIREIATPVRRIITVEDPIENEIPGVNQTQVQHEIGFNFASALRHILRQDPDVIMVGEIRDRETADIGIRASLTGHLVLSTLHTNDSAGAITRLIDMEIEPFLLASSVQLVIAQRLVRRLCSYCSQSTEMSKAALETALKSLHIRASEAEHLPLIKEPKGCERCRNLGYRGRVGIYEILPVDDTIHAMIIQRKSAKMMRQAAVAAGMRTLQESGWEQIKLGNASLNDVLKFAEEFDRE